MKRDLALTSAEKSFNLITHVTRRNNQTQGAEILFVVCEYFFDVVTSK